MKEELQKLRIDKSHRASRHERSNWPWLVLIALLAGGGIIAYEFRGASAAVDVQTIRVRVPDVAVKSDDLVALNATGYIMAAHRVELASKVIGRVSWVGVEMGDRVKKGQVLVRLEDDEYRARVVQQTGQLNNAKARLAELKAGSRPQEIAQALAAVDQTRVELENAERNFKRLNAIQGTRSISQQEIDDAETLMKSRRAQLDSAQQQYEMLKAGTREEQIAAQQATVSQLEGSLSLSMVDLDNTVIHSPMDATILERNVEIGEFVTNGFVGDRGAKGYVVSIADLQDLLVELDISQNDFSKVAMKQPCWVTTDAYPDRKYDGVVELISPVANRQKATVEVRVKISKPDDLLKPDMNATVSFLSMAKVSTSQSADAPTDQPPIRVPSKALRDGAVFVVEQGHAKRRPVTVGMTAANGDVEVRKGLIGGEDLIVDSPAALQDGQLVKVSVSK